MPVDILKKVNTNTNKCIPVKDLIKDIQAKIDSNPDILLREIAADFNNQKIFNSRGKPYREDLISWGILTYLGDSYRRVEKYTKTSGGNKATVDNSSQISEGIKVESFKKKQEKSKINSKSKTLLASSSTDDLIQALMDKGYKVTITKG